LGASNVGSGTLTVTATGANSITQTGAIVQAAAAGGGGFTTRAGGGTLAKPGKDLPGGGGPEKTRGNHNCGTRGNADRRGGTDRGQRHADGDGDGGEQHHADRCDRAGGCGGGGEFHHRCWGDHADQRGQ